MKDEYVGLTHSEKVYGQRHLLQAQLEMLDSMQRLQNYKNYRKEELVLKLTLKNKLGEILGLLADMDKILPKPTYKIKGVKEEGEEAIWNVEEEEELTLEDEIELVRRKLENLESK